MLSNKNLAFAILAAMLGAANATVYNVALSYKMKEGTLECAEEDSVDINAISDEALNLAGMALGGSSGNWRVIQGRAADPANGMLPENSNGGGNGVKAADDWGVRMLFEEMMDERKLGGWCEFMCKSTGRYCYCCSSCGSRRMLRVAQGTPMPEVEQAVTDAALHLLEQEGLAIACLDYPYDLEVTIEKTQNV